MGLKVERHEVKQQSMPSRKCVHGTYLGGGDLGDVVRLELGFGDIFFKVGGSIDVVFLGVIVGGVAQVGFILEEIPLGGHQGEVRGADVVLRVGVVGLNFGLGLLCSGRGGSIASSDLGSGEPSPRIEPVDWWNASGRSNSERDRIIFLQRPLLAAGE